MKYLGVPLDYVGQTARNLDHLHLINQIGPLLLIQGFKWASSPDMPFARRYLEDIAFVVVHGEGGAAAFHGFNWGYGGEGPRGLSELFKAAGVAPGLDRYITREMEHNGWEILRVPPNWYCTTRYSGGHILTRAFPFEKFY